MPTDAAIRSRRLRETLENIASSALAELGHDSWTVFDTNADSEIHQDYEPVPGAALNLTFRLADKPTGRFFNVVLRVAENTTPRQICALLTQRLLDIAP